MKVNSCLEFRETREHVSWERSEVNFRRVDRGNQFHETGKHGFIKKVGCLKLEVIDSVTLSDFFCAAVA